LDALSEGSDTDEEEWASGAGATAAGKGAAHAVAVAAAMALALQSKLLECLWVRCGSPGDAVNAREGGRCCRLVGDKLPDARPPVPALPRGETFAEPFHR